MYRRPPMARRQTTSGGQRRRVGAAFALALLAIGVLAAGSLAWSMLGSATPASQAPPTHGASPSPRATALASSLGQTPPATPTGGPSPTPSAASPSPAPASATPIAGRAPLSAAEFDLEQQVILIGFPLRPETRYHYRDKFRNRRDGPPSDYNHARRDKDGELMRLHDGIDIYAREGEPVVAPFSGLVIDAATRWIPWEPDRYGLTVVIVSDEPETAGYLALLAHLERAWVDPGQRVSRGQVIGVLGGTGNAESVDPQLHFELRAPFVLDWSALGEERLVDAFNPYPSLIEADPHRN